MLFDDTTLRRLNQLTLVAARIRAGSIQGDRRSTRRGNSVEFADYRNYAPGDDLRRLDWNIYARLERPFIKLFEEEEDLAVTILLDGSGSMAWGQGDLNKFDYARRLAGGLGAVALSSGDQLTISLLQDGQLTAEEGPARGPAVLARFFRFLEKLETGGQTDLNGSMRQAAIRPRRAGLVIVISDLLAPDGYESGLRELLGRGNEAVLIHLLAPDELDPQMAGDLQLVDFETGREQDVSLDGALRGLYRQRAQAWLNSIRSDCRKRGIRYLQLNTREPWDQALLLEMRQAGIVK